MLDYKYYRFTTHVDLNPNRSIVVQAETRSGAEKLLTENVLDDDERVKDIFDVTNTAEEFDDLEDFFRHMHVEYSDEKLILERGDTAEEVLLGERNSL